MRWCSVDSKRHEEVLSHIDKTLGELPPVACWRCDERMGEPSTCKICLKEMLDSGEKPPKSHKWRDWTGS